MRDWVKMTPEAAPRRARELHAQPRRSTRARNPSSGNNTSSCRKNRKSSWPPKRPARGRRSRSPTCRRRRNRTSRRSRRSSATRRRCSGLRARHREEHRSSDAAVRARPLPAAGAQSLHHRPRRQLPSQMQNSKSPIATPTVKRRLICMVYEAFLLTAVEALAMFRLPVRHPQPAHADHRPWPQRRVLPGRGGVLHPCVDRQRTYAGDEDVAHQGGQAGLQDGAVSRRGDALPDGVGLVPAGDRGVLRVRAGRARARSASALAVGIAAGR